MADDLTALDAGQLLAVTTPPSVAELLHHFVAVPGATLTVRLPGIEVEVRVPGAPDPTPYRGAWGVHSGVAKKLLAAASTVPTCAKKLCSLAGVTDNSRAGEAITALCRARLLVRLPDGLVLAEEVARG